MYVPGHGRKYNSLGDDDNDDVWVAVYCIVYTLLDCLRKRESKEKGMFKTSIDYAFTESCLSYNVMADRAYVVRYNVA
jgi:hypothetical protein